MIRVTMGDLWWCRTMTYLNGQPEDNMDIPIMKEMRWIFIDIAQHRLNKSKA